MKLVAMPTDFIHVKTENARRKQALCGRRSATGDKWIQSMLTLCLVKTASNQPFAVFTTPPKELLTTSILPANSTYGILAYGSLFSPLPNLLFQ